MANPPLLIAVMGTTASGKSALAEELASQLDAQLINADAFQVYKGMDIGTAKPTDKAKYKLLDLVNPSEQYGLGQFLQDAASVLNKCFEQRRNAILVGGTGLYIRGLVEGYSELAPPPTPELRQSIIDRENKEGKQALIAELQKLSPETAAKTDLANPLRVRRALERLYSPKLEPTVIPPFSKLKLALIPPTEILRDRITQRTKEMLANGWLEEVQNLLNSGFELTDPGFRAIGYRELALVLQNEIKLDDAFSRIITQTCQYAKRQRTWLRSEPNLRTLEWGKPFNINNSVTE